MSDQSRGSSQSDFPTFIQAERKQDLEGAELCVLGVPFDHALSRQRPICLGPLALREKSLVVNNYSLGTYPWFYKLSDSFKVIDYGDLTFSIDDHTPRILDSLAETTGSIIRASASVLALGGAHTISIGTIRAYRKRFGRLSLLHLDAHNDIVNRPGASFHNGSWAWDVVQEGWVAPERSAQVYVRTCMHPYSQSPLGYNVIWAKEAIDMGWSLLAQGLRSLFGSHPVYLSFDIDAVDCCYAPGTGTPSAGGPSSFEVLSLLHALRGLNIVGADVVEVNPDFDRRNDVTSLVGAHVAINLLYLLAEARTRSAEGSRSQFPR